MPLLRALTVGVILTAAPLQATPLYAAAPSSIKSVLRVGVADGSQPCSFRKQGSWSGMAVELWQRVADQERLPYVFIPGESAASLLEATNRGELDVAIGCITLSPERLRSSRFSLPIQESGLGVMTKLTRLDLGVSLLKSLLTPDLMRLLLAYVGLIALLSVAVWRVERAGSKPSEWTVGPRRAFALIFQVLATGPGTNTVVVTSRGHALVFLSYLVRIVSASLLVSYVTINVVRSSPDSASRSLRTLNDLAGQRVAVRLGTVSDELLQSLNAEGLQPPIERRELRRIPDADSLLTTNAVDAVMADDIQLDYLLHQLSDKRFSLVLRNLNPQSQAFAFSPALNDATASRINVALGRLKRDGVVSQLRRQAINGS